MIEFKKKEKVTLNDVFVFMYLRTIQKYFDSVKESYVNPGLIGMI